MTARTATIRKAGLQIVLSCLAMVFLGATTYLPAYAQDRPALSDADKQKVMTWMARRAASAHQPYCYRQSDPRGVGKPLEECAPGEQENGALCYPQCREGYGGAGPVCWEHCPSGYTDTGALCTRGADTTHLHYQAANCPSHFRNMGASCYRAWPPKSISMSHMTCPAGMYRKGGFCYQSCPEGYSNTGVSCFRPADTIAKKTYTRGAGSPMQCEAGQEEDAGLCYSQCKAGFHGVGPVCWQNCPDGKEGCGAGCASSKMQCVSNTANMVIAPLMLAVNILTFGESSETEAAMKEVKAAAAARDLKATRAAFGRLLEGYAARLEEMTSKEVVDTLKEKFTTNAYKWVAKEYVKLEYQMVVQQQGPQADQTLRDLAGLDPTGVAGVVEAYTQPKCFVDEPFPSVEALY